MMMLSFDVLSLLCESASLSQYQFISQYIVMVKRGNTIPNANSTMEQRCLKNVNNCLYTNVYSYFETSGGISYNPYLNGVIFFN
jgi:hypothetical protein